MVPSAPAWSLRKSAVTAHTACGRQGCSTYHSETFCHIYEYKCHCYSRYVGRTFQRLRDRIKQHVPQWL